MTGSEPPFAFRGFSEATPNVKVDINGSEQRCFAIAERFTDRCEPRPSSGGSLFGQNTAL